MYTYVCLYLFCVYVCNTRVCAYMHTCKHMNVCVWGGHVHVFACLCMCAFYVCVCALCACLPACMFTFPYRSFFWMHLYPLSSVGSLGFPESRHFVFFQYLSVISSSCLTASLRTVMNSEDRGSLTLCILVGI